MEPFSFGIVEESYKLRERTEPSSVPISKVPASLSIANDLPMIPVSISTIGF